VTPETLANLALKHLAVTRRVTNLETDQTPEAVAIRAFLPQALEEVLREHPWPFATSFAALDPVQDDPTVEWPHSHRLPEDCLFVHRILQERVDRRDTRQSRARWRIVRDNVSGPWDATRTYGVGEYASVSGEWFRSLVDENLGNNPHPSHADWVAIAGTPPSLLYSDLADVTIEYRVNVTDLRDLPPDVASALAARLALYIIPSVTQDERGAVTQRVAFLEARLLAQAKENAANEESPDEAPESEFYRSRL